MDISEIAGLTFEKVIQDGQEIHFLFKNGKGYKLYHEQDCCEYTYIESIVGDLNDLQNTPILLADEATGNMENCSESGSWTFYRFRTMKGNVDIRFCVESNGYYSESVDFGDI